MCSTTHVTNALSYIIDRNSTALLVEIWFILQYYQVNFPFSTSWAGDFMIPGTQTSYSMFDLYCQVNKNSKLQGKSTDTALLFAISNENLQLAIH